MKIKFNLQSIKLIVCSVYCLGAAFVSANHFEWVKFRCEKEIVRIPDSEQKKSYHSPSLCAEKFWKYKEPKINVYKGTTNDSNVHLEFSDVMEEPTLDKLFENGSSVQFMFNGSYHSAFLSQEDEIISITDKCKILQSKVDEPRIEFDEASDTLKNVLICKFKLDESVEIISVIKCIPNNQTKEVRLFGLGKENNSNLLRLWHVSLDNIEGLLSKK